MKRKENFTKSENNPYLKNREEQKDISTTEEKLNKHERTSQKALSFLFIDIDMACW